MGKAFEKQIKTIEDQGEKQVETLKDLRLNEIEGESSNKSTGKDIHNKILEERMDEILKTGKEINYNNLVDDFKLSNRKINFTVFMGPVYTYEQLKKGEKTLQQVDEEQKDFKKDLNEIKSRNPEHKSEKQVYVIKKRLKSL